MSLKEDFQDVAYEMTRIKQTEQESLITQAKKKIDAITQETEILLQKKKAKLDQDLIQKRIAELNISKSERIALINRRIVEKKNQCIETFMEFLKNEIRQQIQANPKNYFECIGQKIQILSPLLRSSVKLQFNATDLGYLHKNPSLNPIPLQLENMISIDTTPIDIFIGFRIIAVDHSFSIDESWDLLIQKRRWNLSKLFMEIFPLKILELNREKDRDALHHDSE